MASLDQGIFSQLSGLLGGGPQGESPNGPALGASLLAGGAAVGGILALLVSKGRISGPAARVMQRLGINFGKDAAKAERLAVSLNQDAARIARMGDQIRKGELLSDAQVRASARHLKEIQEIVNKTNPEGVISNIRFPQKEFGSQASQVRDRFVQGFRRADTGTTPGGRISDAGGKSLDRLRTDVREAITQPRTREPGIRTRTINDPPELKKPKF